MNRCLIAVIALSLYVPTLRAQEAKEATERTEDIEVLRRILNKSLGLTPQVQNVDLRAAEPSGPFYPTLVSPLSDPAQFHLAPFTAQNQSGRYVQNLLLRPTQADATRITQPTIAPFDGIYLKGHGVVYTLKIPAGAPSPLNISKSFGLSETCVKCHSLDVVPKAAVEAELDVKEGNKPYIEWLRTQDELRGKKPTDAPAQATDVPICEPGKLTARLTEKLFHNQHHVRNVPDSESFTVVVTYESYAGSAQKLTKTTAAELLDKRNPFDTENSFFTLEQLQQIRLGDLHRKNQKYQEAVDAYTLALKEFPKAILSVTGYGPEEFRTAEQRSLYSKQLLKKVNETYQSLAEVYLALKMADKARDALETSRKLVVNFKEGLQATATVTGIAVPAKLILSFKRSDVTNDEVDFRKVVKVETIGFPPADPKPTPAKK